jgi:hypothetical protein
MAYRCEHDDAETLSLMRVSFEKAWQEIVARNIAENANALRNAIALRIKSAVLLGVRDADRLVALALDAVDPTDRATHSRQS